MKSTNSSDTQFIIKTGLVTSILISLVFIPYLAAASTQDLTYDNPTNQVNITYDYLNRISTKNSTNADINYSYDDQYQGTLTNITFGNDTIKYQYDDKLRLTKEIRIIDGIQFEKIFAYDSMDRLVETNVAGKEIEFYYNNQSRVNKISNYITSAFYDAFDKLLNRTYASTKVTEYVYNDSNSRLQQIKTDAIQNLNYSYDAVGNVILINDTANNRTYRMSYDYLDRLVNVSIGGNTWSYAYNSIGNILKIVRDNVNTTKFVYKINPVHAPLQVITGDAGIDVHKLGSLYSADRNQTFQFYLANDKNSTITNVNWTAEFGDGRTAVSTIGFDLLYNDTILVIVQNNYSAGGNHKVNVTSRSNPASYDFENLTDKFGITINSLSFTGQNADKANFNIIISNGFNFTVNDINWACDNGAQSNSSFSISSLSSRTEYFNRTYSSPGTKYLNCNVTSSEGNDTKFVKFDMSGIKIEDYNSSSVAENNRNVQFAIKNYWAPVAVNWNIRSDGQLFSDTTATLATNGSAAISQSINYTTDGSKIVNATIISGGMSDVYNESFSLSAIRIENLESYKNNETNQRILRFNITNYWPHTISNVNWRISDPLTTSNDSVTLSPGESRNFTVQINYSSQGVKSPGLLAYNGTFNSSTSDRFAVKMVQILNNLVLKESKDSTIQIAEIINNMGSQVLSWLINSGQQTIYSTQNVSLNNSEQVFVIIETNYTASNVYLPNVTVNSTSYNDTRSGIVVA